MGLFDFWKTQPNHLLTDEERLAGGEKRKANLELSKLKLDLEREKLALEGEKDKLRLQAEIEEYRQKLEDLQGYDDDENEGGGRSMEDTLVTSLLAKVLAGQQPAITPAVQPPVIVQTASAPLEITDTQIAQLWKAQGKDTQNFIKALDDAQIVTELKERLPQLSDDAVRRALDFIHKERQKGFKGFFQKA